MKPKHTLVMFSSVVMLSCAQFSQAVPIHTISINDITETITLTDITAAGTNVNGITITDPGNNQQYEFLSYSYGVGVGVDCGTPGTPDCGSHTYDFYEPGGTVWSDRLVVDFSPGNGAIINFWSDSNPLVPTPPVTSIDVPFGTPINFTESFSGNLVDDTGITVRSIPEPASIILLGLALAGLGFSRRKQ